MTLSQAVLIAIGISGAIGFVLGGIFTGSRVERIRSQRDEAWRRLGLICAIKLGGKKPNGTGVKMQRIARGDG